MWVNTCGLSIKRMARWLIPEQSYENAYQAAAKYINASRDEIGALLTLSNS